jgi:hypothetical protein
MNTQELSAICIQKIWRSYRKEPEMSSKYQLYFDQEAREIEERFQHALQEEMDWLKRMETHDPSDYDSEWEQCDEDDYKNERLHECP